jgi:hypothetical protein
MTMGKTITLFMWGYQSHFRILLELRAKRAIQAIAPTIESKGLLVGVRTLEKTDGYPVCVEPEDEGWNPKIFFNCNIRTEEIYKEHPDHNIIYGDEPRMRDKPENIRKKSVREAVKEVVLKYDSQHGTFTFCGWPTRVEGYYVVPILQFDKTQLLEYPHLSEPIRFDRFESSTGLIQSVIDCLLEKATDALEKKEPGRFFDTFPEENSSILQKAGRNFCYAVTISTGDIFLQGIFDVLNDISSLPYEGGDAIGGMIFCSANEQELRLQVQLKDTISIYNHKLARKMIEISGKELFCVCQGNSKFPGVNNGITGFGTLQSIDANNIFRIDFVGRYKWDLYYKNNLLMRVAYGVPSLSLPRINEDVFRSDVKRIISDILEEGENRIWDVVQAAIAQKKGTMIVISNNADVEAERPTEMTAELVSRLSGIDGAILIDSNGICHAVGVILDGKATEEGDQSRGARYNSAIRYIASSEHPTICIVVSEDGHVDVLPKLRPKIDISTILKMLEMVKSTSKEDYNKAIHWLGEHRFYLTEEQCNIINIELKRIKNTPMELGEIRITINPFVPYSGMNDSYYL